MDSCSRCNWSGPAGLATCPRCGQALAAVHEQSAGRPVLLPRVVAGDLPSKEWEIEGVPVGIGRLDHSDEPEPPAPGACPVAVRLPVHAAAKPCPAAGGLRRSPLPGQAPTEVPRPQAAAPGRARSGDAACGLKRAVQASWS
jgi:hypothetical protein